MVTYNYIEMARDDGHRVSVSPEAATAVCTYMLKGVNASTPPPVRQLSEFATYLMGTVDNLTPKVVRRFRDSGAGKIRRTLPKFHPFMPDLSVVGIPGFRGVGTQQEADSVSVFLRDPITPQFTHYTEYEYEVEFGKRPYPMLHDDLIPVKAATYYPPGGAPSIEYEYAEEWRRFTRINPQPSPDTVASEHGGFIFRTDGSAGTPDGATFTGQTFLFLQNQMIDVEWYQVPLRYIQNHTVDDVTYKSYLTRFANTVNHYDWNGFPAGTLLYLGPQVINIYTPPVPQLPEVFGVSVNIAPAQCCNLRLKFQYTGRRTDAPPDGGTKGLANLNNIAAGHNAQPNYVDRKFYYVASQGPSPGTDTTKWNAPFQSFPTELLFTDPMLAQPGGLI